MQVKQLNRSVTASKEDSMCSEQASFVIKIYINTNMQAEINLNNHSDIDELIRACICKYNLKKEAHGYLKQQIQFAMKESGVQNCSQELPQPQSKKQFVLKDLKAGDIDLKKITVQRTPKNLQDLSSKKEVPAFKSTKKSQNNPRIFLAKKKTT